jgi:hypothetical protein
VLLGYGLERGVGSWGKHRPLILPIPGREVAPTNACHVSSTGGGGCGGGDVAGGEGSGF